MFNLSSIIYLIFLFYVLSPNVLLRIPPQRLQTRGCSRACCRIRRSVLLHIGLRQRTARFTMKKHFKHEE